MTSEQQEEVEQRTRHARNTYVECFGQFVFVRFRFVGARVSHRFVRRLVRETCPVRLIGS
jgi:hypothetical protein